MFELLPRAAKRAARIGALSLVWTVASAIGPTPPAVTLSTPAYVSPYTAPLYLGPARTPAQGISHFGYLLSGYTDFATAANVREIAGHANLAALVHNPSDAAKDVDALAGLGPEVTGMVFVDLVFVSKSGIELPGPEVARNLAALKAVVAGRWSYVRYLGLR